MQFEWRFQTWKPDGSGWRILSMHGGGIAEVSSARLSPGGDCLEMEFIASPYHSGLRARDIVLWQVRVPNTSDAGWRNAWRGFIVQAGNPRRRELRRFRALGLKHRLRERVIERWFTTGDAEDVAQHVRLAFAPTVETGFRTQRWSWPEGITYDEVRVPPLGLSVGPTYPRLTIAGEYLDALAETVGRFVVPSGEQYTHDGRTWSAGSEVQACEWGVNADGNFFFRRPTSPVVNANEVAADTRVEWLDVSAEDVADQVVVVFLNAAGEGYSVASQEGVKPLPEPLFRIYGAVDAEGRPNGALDAQKRVVLDNPLDWMERRAFSVGLIGDWTDPGQAVDGNDGTYAELASKSFGSHYSVGGLSGIAGAVVRLRCEVGSERELTISIPGYGTYRPVLEAGLKTLYLPALNSDVDASNTTGLPVTLDNWEIGDRIYDVSAWTPDDARVARMAEGVMREVRHDASEVRRYAQLGPVSALLRLTTIEGSVLVRRVEAVEYRLTAEEGLVTAYLLEQRDEGGSTHIQDHLDALLARRSRAEAERVLKRRLGAQWGGT